MGSPISIDSQRKPGKFTIIQGGRDSQATTTQPIQTIPSRPVRDGILDAYLDGYSYGEIAARMGVSSSMVQLVLWGHQQIEMRKATLLSLQATPWEREGCMEIEQQTWQEIEASGSQGRAA